jgi:hypothetical protein
METMYKCTRRESNPQLNFIRILLYHLTTGTTIPKILFINQFLFFSHIYTNFIRIGHNSKKRSTSLVGFWKAV